MTPEEAPAPGPGLSSAPVTPEERPAAVRLIPTRAGAPAGAGLSGDSQGATPSVAQVSDGQVRTLLDASRRLAVPGEVYEMMCLVAEAAIGLLDCERAS